MKKDIAIKLTNVSKKYVIHHKKPTLSERLLNGKGEEFWALKNINLTIKKGNRVGVIGANGSGKTTLLKIICGIAAPTSGKVKTSGKIVSLIDLEAGFHPDLTGIQNIYLNGTLLGMGRREIDRKLDDIIRFADIGKFIDAQLFTYSSGMALRLGFAVAVHADPDILVVDEGMAAGDIDFQRKSNLKIREFFSDGKTIIMASHDMRGLKKFCTKVVWLKEGGIGSYGEIDEVIRAYEKRI
jgi:ABC-type polysaccharide/polyol phosphate transport system ATPase subunit